NQSSHPGRVIQIAENPQDANKLLIAFSSGLIILWDLRTRSTEARFRYNERLYGFCWHWEGKSFLTCHKYGLLATWSCRQPQRPTSVICPHAGGDTIPDDYQTYEPIQSVDWLPCKNGEPFIIFVGGGRASTPDNPVTTPSKTPSDSDLAPPNPGTSVSPDASAQSAVTSAHSGSVSSYPCLTVKRGKRLVVLQMDYRVVQFVSLCASPFIGELMDPYAVAVLLQNDFVVVDLLSPNYATFENPYPMDIHSSPVTSCLYLVDCPGDLVPAFYPLGTRSSTRSKRAADSDTFSTREWPIIGGECGISYNPYPELVLTGHADGSVRFWDASEVNLTPLYKIRTLRYFDATKTQNPNSTGEKDQSTTSASPETGVNANFASALLSTEMDPYAIRFMHFCPESRRLLVAGSAHVCLMHFSRREQQYEIPVDDAPMGFSFDPLLVDFFKTRTEEEQLSGILYKLDPGNLIDVRMFGANTVRFSVTEYDLISQMLVLLVVMLRSTPIATQSSVIDINMAYDCLEDVTGPGTTDPFSDEQSAFGAPSKENVFPRTRRTCPSDSVGSAHSAFATDNDVRVFVPVRPGSVTWHPGYQPTLICRMGIPSYGFDSSPNDPTLIPPPPITAISLNSKYGLLAIGSESGFALVDFQNCVCLIATSTADLIAPSDVFTRPQPNRSPGRTTGSSPGESKPMDQIFPKPAAPPRPRPPSHLQPIASRSQAPVTTPPKPVQSETQTVPPQAVPVTAPEPVVGMCCNCCPWDTVKTGATSTAPRIVIARARAPSFSELNVSPPIETTPDNKKTVSVPTDSTPQDHGRQHRYKKVHPGHSSKSKEHGALQTSNWSVSLLDLSQLNLPSIPGEDLKTPLLIDHLLQLKAVSPMFAALVLACQANTVSRRQLIGQEKWPDFGPISQSGSMSASVSSLEQSGNDGVKFTCFAESFVRAPGSLFRLNGEVLFIAFLDLTGELLSPPWEKWEDVCRPITQQTSNSSSAVSSAAEPGASVGFRQGDSSAATRRLGGGPRPPKDVATRQVGASLPRTPSSSTSSSSGPPGNTPIFHQTSLAGTPDTGPPSQSNEPDKQLLVICSEKQARVVSLPSQTCLYKVKITETSQVIRASVQRFPPGSIGNGDVSGPTTFLACYLANGHFLAFSLPSLRMLMDVDYLPCTECVSHSFAFGQHGQAVYMSSPSELVKITWAADLCANLKDMQGELFLPCNMPEPPKRNFLMNLFSGTTNTSLDRDEL
ncbi:syntaxin binding protein 5, partial [Clonorchis sinensis]